MSSLVPSYIANADRALFDAMGKLEKAVEDEGLARDVFTDAKLAFELAYGNYIRDHKKEGTITVLKELAQTEHFELYSKMTKSESNLKKLQAGKELQIERINAAKTFLKIKLGDLRGNS